MTYIIMQSVDGYKWNTVMMINMHSIARVTIDMHAEFIHSEDTIWAVKQKKWKIMQLNRYMWKFTCTTQLVNSQLNQNKNKKMIMSKC
jgi:hypothetical protein